MDEPLAAADRQPSLPQSLVKAIRADPKHMPELLADFARRHRGPRARRVVARLREQNEGATPDELRALVEMRSGRTITTEGAFVGGPLLVFAPFAFCAALLAQSQMVLELAEVAGRDAAHPDRAAELLVLQGVHPDLPQARAALSEAAQQQDKRRGKREKGGPGTGGLVTLWALTLRMARLLGLTTPDEGRRPSRLMQAGQWILVGLVFLVGMAAPLVWLPYMAASYRHATARLVDRAVAFYLGEPSRRVEEPTHTDPGMAAATVRGLSSLLFAALAVAFVVLSDIRVAGSRWPALTMALITASSALGVYWHVRRLPRRRRARRITTRS